MTWAWDSTATGGGSIPDGTLAVRITLGMLCLPETVAKETCHDDLVEPDYCPAKVARGWMVKRPSQFTQGLGAAKWELRSEKNYPPPTPHPQPFLVGLSFSLVDEAQT